MSDTSRINPSDEPISQEDIPARNQGPSQAPAESFQSMLEEKEHAIERRDQPFRMQSPMDLMRGSQQVAQVSPEAIRQQLERSSTKLTQLQSSYQQLNPSNVSQDSHHQLHKHLQQISDSLNSSSLVMGQKAESPLSPPKRPLKMLEDTVKLLEGANSQISILGSSFSKENTDQISIGKLLRIQYHLYRLERSVELSTAIIGKSADALNKLFNTQL